MKYKISSFLNILTGVCLIWFMLLEHNTMSFDWYLVVYLLGGVAVVCGLLGMSWGVKEENDK